MAEAIKIRAQAREGITDIRMLMTHPMESGLRKDADTGKAIPAEFIRVVTVRLNDRVVLEAHFNTAVSRNPVIAFKVRGGKAGDRVGVGWVDSKGEQRSDETLVH